MKYEGQHAGILSRVELELCLDGLAGHNLRVVEDGKVDLLIYFAPAAFEVVPKQRDLLDLHWLVIGVPDFKLLPHHSVVAQDGKAWMAFGQERHDAELD